MTQRGSFWIVLGAIGSIALPASGALAQDFSDNLVPRCQVAALQVSRDSQEPCKEQIAVFGLNGPTVLASRTRDVETTGSIAAGQTGRDSADSR